MVLKGYEEYLDNRAQEFANLACFLCSGASAACVADPFGYLFFDGIHTTTAGQAYVAGRVLAAVVVPEPHTFALVASGLILTAGARRRTR